MYEHINLDELVMQEVEGVKLIGICSIIEAMFPDLPEGKSALIHFSDVFSFFEGGQVLKDVMTTKGEVPCLYAAPREHYSVYEAAECGKMNGARYVICEDMS